MGSPEPPEPAAGTVPAPPPERRRALALLLRVVGREVPLGSPTNAAVRRLAEVFGRFQQGDLSGVDEAFSPRCTWTQTGHGPLAGVWSGHDGVKAWLTAVRESGLQTDFVEIRADDDLVVFSVRHRGERPGLHVDVVAVQTVALDADGLFLDLRHTTSDDEVWHRWFEEDGA